MMETKCEQDVNNPGLLKRSTLLDRKKNLSQPARYEKKTCLVIPSSKKKCRLQGIPRLLFSHIDRVHTEVGD